MRGYGLPRRACMVCPDLYEINYYGLKSSLSRVPKYGSIKNSFRNSKAKRDTRRIWKKKQRAANSKDTRQRAQEAIE